MWLEGARHALEEGRLGAALIELLEAWRRRRLPALADEIDRLSDTITLALPPIGARTRKGLHQQWLDVLNEHNPLDLGRLLAVFQTQPWIAVGERVELLSNQDDPRVTKAFAAFVEALPTLNSRWTLLFKRLEKSNDGRVRRALEARLKVADQRLMVTNQLHPLCRRVLEALVPIEASAEELVELTELRKVMDVALRSPQPPADELRAQGKKPSARSEDELLQLIYETPEDDGPRLVYGDWLQEQGNPRAELLLLQLKPQLTKKDQARAKRLVKEHGRQWLGPLEPAIVFRSETFERGFVAKASIEFKTPQQRERLFGHPAWNTITSVYTFQLEPSFFTSTELRGLEFLQGVSGEVAEAIARRTTPLRRLGQLDLSALSLDELRRLPPELFPVLRRLTWVFHGRDDRAVLAQLQKSPPAIFGALHTLTLHGYQDPEALAPMASLPTLECLELSRNGTLRFFRRANGWLMEVEPSPWLLRYRNDLSPILTRFMPHVVAVRAPRPEHWGDVYELTLAAFRKALQGSSVELV